MLLLTWQALRGQSIVSPDAATFAAFVGLLAVTVLTTLAIVVRPTFRQS